jgi:acyl-CoA reductase-like NAD-dependent aldehyde dehydrogenase
VRTVAEASAVHNKALYRGATAVFTRLEGPGLTELRESLRTGSLNINRGTVGASLRLPAVGLGRASGGLPGGLDLMRAVTYPRASLTETRPFDPRNVVPGVRWTDAVAEDSSEEGERLAVE